MNSFYMMKTDSGECFFRNKKEVIEYCKKEYNYEFKKIGAYETVPTEDDVTIQKVHFNTIKR